MHVWRHDQGARTGPGAIIARKQPPGAEAVVAACLAVSATELRRAWPLVLPGMVGITGGGLIAAGVAHAPTPAVVWLVAYLVLVVGVAQLALAVGQALLASPAVSVARIRLESLLFNVGSAGVTVGAINSDFLFVVFGTVLFAGALGAFLFAVRGGSGAYAAHAYRMLIAFLSISALAGLLLSASGA